MPQQATPTAAAMPSLASPAAAVVPPTAAAAAATALPAQPPEGAMGALPAGWHACMDATHQRPYYFNTVTKESQWTFPTAAAAVPLDALPRLNDSPKHASPGAVRRVGNELGGVGDMASAFGLAGVARKPPVNQPDDDLL